jgi:heme-degrading monooxygenase HmoA
MALARVVTFDGVSKDRMAELKKEMESGEAPEGFPSSELIVLHDPDAEKSVVVVVFESEDDYKKGDEILTAMPASDTPGQRTSVTKYDVAMRMKS